MLRYVLYLVLLYKIILTSRYELRQLYFLAVLLLVSGASYLGCGDFTLGELSILCIASLQVDEKHLLHCFAAVKGIAFIMTILLWWMQVLPELYYWNGQNYYLTYGFCHRNVMGANVAFLCLAWFMIRYARLRIWDVLLWCLVAAFLYGIAFSRTTLLFIVLTAAGLYALQLTDPFITDPAELKQLLILLFLTMVLISLYCMAAYDSGNSVWRSIDAFFTTRIRSGNYVYETYGVSPFGRELPFVSSIQAQQTGAAKLILDNTYMRLLLYYGLIPFLLVCLGIPAIISGALYKKQLLLAVCILLVAVFGLSERYMLDAYYNFPLLIGFRYAFDRKPLNF
ncbi:MAG: hypothetical protein Q4B03_09560 [Lachnospiraceae bacterium]|nr:hypothetical protein [Lachnospiraceae bacterium]